VELLGSPLLRSTPASYRLGLLAEGCYELMAEAVDLTAESRATYLDRRAVDVRAEAVVEVTLRMKNDREIAAD